MTLPVRHRRRSFWDRQMRQGTAVALTLGGSIVLALVIIWAVTS